jgi:hypothetical protein
MKSSALLVFAFLAVVSASPVGKEARKIAEVEARFDSTSAWVDPSRPVSIVLVPTNARLTSKADSI